MKLSDAEEPIRRALERLVDSPRELRCFVIIEDTLVGRFVQFCTPPPPPKFFRPSDGDEGPLFFDGTGIAGRDTYRHIGESCDIERGVRRALETLAEYLPPQAELSIIEESTQTERPS